MAFLEGEIPPEKSQALYQALQQATRDVGLPKEEMSPSELVAYQNRLQGRLGEVLALRTFSEQGRDVSDLNPVIMNMPGFDVKAGDDWVSVKTLSVAAEKPNLSSYRHYLDVLSEHSEPAHRGKYMGQGLPQYAANTLIRVSKDDEIASSLVNGQNSEELSHAMWFRGCIALPEDHCEAMQSYLQGDFRQYVLSHPDRYSIDQNVTEVEQERAIKAVVDDYCRRLRPLGFTSEEIHLALNRILPVRGKA